MSSTPRPVSDSEPDSVLDSTPDVSQTLASRYGTNTSGASRKFWLVILIIGGVIFVATALWAAYGLSQSDVSWQDRGYKVHDETSVTVHFSVTMDPGTSARCTLEALNARYAQVGLVDVEIPASEARTTTHSANVATQELAVTGIVNTCVVN